MLHEYQDLRYEKDLSSPISYSATSAALPPLQTSALLNSSEISGLDFVKFVHPGSINPELNATQLSHDEKIVLLKAEQEEQEYHREIQMTTLINSRYPQLNILYALTK